MTTPRNPASSQKKPPVGGSGMTGGGGDHKLAPRSIAVNRAGFKGGGGGGNQGHPGKDALFSFDQKKLDMFSLPAGGAAGGGGARGLRGLAGARKARPPKSSASASAESPAPKGTEGATAAGAGGGAVAASLSKIFPAPPVRSAAPVPESPRKAGSTMNGEDGGRGGDKKGELLPDTACSSW